MKSLTILVVSFAIIASALGNANLWNPNCRQCYTDCTEASLSEECRTAMTESKDCLSNCRNSGNFFSCARDCKNSSNVLTACALSESCQTATRDAAECLQNARQECMRNLLN